MQIRTEDTQPMMTGSWMTGQSMLLEPVSAAFYSKIGKSFVYFFPPFALHSLSVVAT